MTKPNMTPVQKQVYTRLTNEWQCADELNAQVRSLKALYSNGFADVRFLIDAELYPRTQILFKKSDNGTTIKK